MVPLQFDVARLPQILFGSGRRGELAGLIDRSNVQRILFVTGAQTLQRWDGWQALCDVLARSGKVWTQEIVATEPSPQHVDAIVSKHFPLRIEWVVGIGGGSVLDAAKAIAGLLPYGNSVMDHLEGVGAGKPYLGPALPFIAVPTTAGTGSEATKNAVLSVIGPNGYKKSFRHDTLVPQYAIVDPDWLRSCPRAQIAANGMDAFTQLLESYVSINASAFTDAMAWSGLVSAKRGLVDACRGGDDAAAIEGRAQMAYAALLSGVTLAHAGLGSVHGLASPLGAYFPIAHGVVCGTLLAAAAEVNIAALRRRSARSPALAKYAQVGRLFTGGAEDDATAQDKLVEQLYEWTRQLGIPPLRALSVATEDFPRIVAGSRGNSMKTNPVVLEDDEIARILQRAY